MISERLRDIAGKGQGGPLKAEAADVIDALVAALEETRAGCAAYTGGIDGACSESLEKADAALAMARRK